MFSLVSIVANVMMLVFYISSFIIIHKLDSILINSSDPNNDTVKCGPFKFIKIQEVPKTNIMKNWYEGEKISLFNLFVTMPVIGFAASFFMKHPNVFVWYLELFKLIFCVGVVEIWFYITHVIAHHKSIYAYFHKMHHRYTSPVAINALYAHPIDFGITSVFSIVLGCMLIPVHMYTFIVYLFVVITVNTFSHSGYSLYFGKIELLSARYHDDHHRLFNKNYGVGYFMDKIFGTEYLKS